MVCWPIELVMVVAMHGAQKGGGDCKTGTAGILVDGCSCSSPVETLVFFGGDWGLFHCAG